LSVNVVLITLDDVRQDLEANLKSLNSISIPTNRNEGACVKSLRNCKRVKEIAVYI
jgi:hypothetical protein